MKSFEENQAEGGIPPTRQEQPVQVKRPSTSILILGYSGSGKTTFIDTACAEHDPNGVIEKPPTREVTLRHVTIYKHSYELIDTPGFDNPDPDLGNFAVFAKIANYLLDRPRVLEGATGVVYVHRAGDHLRSRTLVQIIRVLSEVFLGRGWFPRVRILVVPNATGEGFPTSISSAMSHQSSAFAEAIAGGAGVVVSNFDKVNFEHILMSYNTTTRALFGIQDDYLKDPNIPLHNRIEDCMGYIESGHLHRRIDAQVERLQRTHQHELSSLRSSLKQSEETVLQNTKHFKQVELELTKHCDEESSLRQQLQQTRTAYTSLRSELQLQENVEQSDIVQTLKDLNRAIDDLGRSVSEFLVDNHVRDLFRKNPTRVTSLHAQHLPELKRLLGHVDGASSLVASSSGVGMRIEDFFDYATRSLICRQLCGRIFDPFHPGVNAKVNNLMADMYHDIRHKESQAIAARWRQNSFKTVYKPETPDFESNYIVALAEFMARNTFGLLITHFFGREAGVALKKEHHDSLERLVRTAWEWNSTLKGEILLLGDFEPTNYRHVSLFDPQLMAEFEAKPGGKEPKAMLATIALGLNCWRAVGGNRPPEMTHVCKAVVATKVLYN